MLPVPAAHPLYRHPLHTLSNPWVYISYANMWQFSLVSTGLRWDTPQMAACIAALIVGSVALAGMTAVFPALYFERNAPELDGGCGVAVSGKGDASAEASGRASLASKESNEGFFA